MKNIRNNLSNCSKYLDNIKVPTSIIWGKFDNIFPVQIAEKLNRSIKNSELITVDENHDWVLYDENKFINLLNKALL